jgi:hypothetical protein
MLALLIVKRCRKAVPKRAAKHQGEHDRNNDIGPWTAALGVIKP